MPAWSTGCSRRRALDGSGILRCSGRMPLAFLTLLAALAAAAVPAPEEIQAPGPQGPLAGTLQRAVDPKAPVMLIIPGSGPTDRDGNNPLGVRAAPYRMLAQDLAAHGVATVRIDK